MAHVYKFYDTKAVVNGTSKHIVPSAYCKCCQRLMPAYFKRKGRRLCGTCYSYTVSGGGGDGGDNCFNDDEMQNANKAQGPQENTESDEPIAKEERPVPRPQRRQRLSSRARYRSPPPRQLIANYEEHWARKIQSEDQIKGTEKHLA